MKIFKHVAGSLVDLFISCQLHISYTRHVKLFLKVLDQEKSCHYLRVDIGAGGIMKKVTNGDIGRKGV